MSGITPSERHLYELCRRSFLSYWSFPNPYRREAKAAKEICDVLVVCDRYVLVFSDKSSAFPDGDIEIAWKRWTKRSIEGSVRQLHGAHRLMQFPQPQIYSDGSLKQLIRCDLAPVADREIHLIAVANGASDACARILGDTKGTMMLSNDQEETTPFMIGDAGKNGPFVHVFTDVSLMLTLGELDTITDLCRYLKNRAEFFRRPLRILTHGEEALIPLYFRGFDASTRDYDMFRAIPAQDEKLDSILIDGDLWDDFVTRPEYNARREENQISYLWDWLVEKFGQHQIQGTGTSSKPSGFERHEGGMRYMALESRVARRSLSQQIDQAIKDFPDDGSIRVRSIMPGGNDAGRSTYLFMQLRPPSNSEYADYRNVRIHLLRVYTIALLTEWPAVDRVVGIACEPIRLFADKAVSEDLCLVERSMLTPQDLASAVAEKAELGLSVRRDSGTWSVREFPDPAIA